MNTFQKTKKKNNNNLILDGFPIFVTFDNNLYAVIFY